MKQACYILILSILLAACRGSSGKEPRMLTGNIQSDIKALLPEGIVKADIMDAKANNPRLVELTLRFQQAVKNNYEWFVDYAQTIPEGEPMPYHENLGMTREEYAELMDLMNNMEVVSTGKENIRIEVKDNIIRFTSRHKLETLNELTIDLANNIVTFGKQKMFFSDTVNVTSDDNGLRSKWKGYSWELNEPDNMDIALLKDISHLTMKEYHLSIGRLEKNGKTLMNLKAREVQDGVKTSEIRISVVF